MNRCWARNPAKTGPETLSLTPTPSTLPVPYPCSQKFGSRPSNRVFVHGIQTPRDALPQSQGGTPVRGARRGDLMFYATDGLVHHVSMYIGDGKMVHSPGTGQTVEVVATSTPAYHREYSGARRYLP